MASVPRRRLCRLVQLKVFSDEDTKNPCEVVDRWIAERFFVVGCFVPEFRKRIGDQVQDGNVCNDS